MTPALGLFETHLTVGNLERSMAFYGETLGLELAEVFRDRRAAFYWIGARGASMLGLWEGGSGPQRVSLHFAFRTDLADLLEAPAKLRAANVIPLDFWGQPSDEPTVNSWMPAASIYFHDPDGNLLEFLAMLPGLPQSELGTVTLSQWERGQGVATN